MQMKIALRYIDSLNGQLIVEPFEKMKMTNVCQEHWLVQILTFRYSTVHNKSKLVHYFPHDYK